MKTLLLALIGLALPAQAYIKKGELQLTPKMRLEAQNSSVTGTNKEHTLKRDLLALKARDPKAFKQLEKNELANPPYYQSYIYEVRDGLSKIEKAKSLAGLSLIKASKNNWDDLSKSVKNDKIASSWKQYEFYLKRELRNDLVYVPRLSDKKHYTFQAGDWGRVKISKNLKVAQYNLDVSSHLDGNRLDPEAKRIRIDKDQEESAPVAAPIMADRDAKTVRPQLERFKNRR